MIPTQNYALNPIEPDSLDSLNPQTQAEPMAVYTEPPNPQRQMQFYQFRCKGSTAPNLDTACLKKHQPSL